MLSSLWQPVLMHVKKTATAAKISQDEHNKTLNVTSIVIMLQEMPSVPVQNLFLVTFMRQIMCLQLHQMKSGYSHGFLSYGQEQNIKKLSILATYLLSQIVPEMTLKCAL